MTLLSGEAFKDDAVERRSISEVNTEKDVKVDIGELRECSLIL